MAQVYVLSAARPEPVEVTPTILARWEDSGAVPEGTADALDDPSRVEDAAAAIAAATASEGV